MTRFAKIAAEIIYDEETDDEPRDKIPAWKRALPWVAGGLGAAGLGYLAYNGLAPKAEGGSVISTIAKPFSVMTESMGGAIPAGFATGAAAGVTSAARDAHLRGTDNKGLSLKELSERGSANIGASGSPKNWANLPPVGYDQEQLRKLLSTDGDSLLHPPEQVQTVDAKGKVTHSPKVYNLAPGGTKDPIAALRQAYGENASIDSIIADLRAKDVATAPAQGLRDAQDLMGGRRIDPGVMSAHLEKMRGAGVHLGNNPKYNIGMNALKRGGAAGVLAALLGVTANSLYLGGK